MKKILTLLVAICSLQYAFAQGCTVTVTAARDTIVCGEGVTLSAFGNAQGNAFLTENFNNGTYGPGWQSTQQAMWNNPCSANGVDGTTHVWMGNSSPVPRALTTTSFNLSSCANAGVTICFDMKMAEQGGTAPCEGPDEPQEGVYIQYSIDNGATWVTLNYFDPNGGSDPLLINWRNWCFPVPQVALTANTKFRWFQDADSGADYDHWGVDNVVIYCNDPTYSIIWPDGYSTGGAGGTNPTAVTPHTTTSYVISMSNGTNSCYDTVTVQVVNPNVVANAGIDTTICAGTCAVLTGTGKIIQRPAKTPTYTNQEIAQIFGTPSVLGIFPGSAFVSMDINITNLNQATVTNGYITSVCVGSMGMSGILGGVELFDIWLVCPSGDSIRLLKDSTIAGTTLTDMCFVPAGANIGTAVPPYTGSFTPNQSFNGLSGCDANGVWSLHFNAVFLSSFVGIPIGFLNSWNISFNDPEISYTGNFTWTPTTNMTNSGTLSPTVCPLPDVYTLTVSDTAGCVTRTDSVRVNTQACCNYQASAVPTSANCGASDGSIDVTMSPAGTYSYVWSDGPSTSPTRSGLASGTYTVTITDANGCSMMQTVIVGAAGQPTVAIATTAAGCTTSTGSATATITSGTATGYNWSSGATTPTASNLAAGNYTVTITEGLCSVTASAVVPVSANPVLAVSTTSAGCNSTTGSATVTVTSGTGSAYLWSSGATTATASNLATGSYTVTVTDAVGCSSTAAATVSSSNGVAISVATTNSTCGNSNGTATVTVTQGSATGYIWSNGSSNAIVTNLATGSYTVTVTDAGSCSATASITISSTALANVAITNNSGMICQGDTAELCAPAGYATYTWNNGLTTQCITTTLPGNYYVSVTDANNCAAGSNTVPVINYPPPPVSVSVNDDSLLAYGSVTYQWYRDGELIPGATSDLYVATESGTYTVLVGTAQGCTSMSLPIVVAVTGVDNLEMETMSVYPNPNTSALWNVSVSKGWLGATCEVYNAEGRLVYFADINNQRSEIQLNVATGVYLMRITAGNKTVTQKLVKM